MAVLVKREQGTGNGKREVPQALVGARPEPVAHAGAKPDVPRFPFPVPRLCAVPGLRSKP